MKETKRVFCCGQKIGTFIRAINLAVVVCEAYEASNLFDEMSLAKVSIGLMSLVKVSTGLLILVKMPLDHFGLRIEPWTPFTTRNRSFK